jgi:hypothetical protein
MLAAVEKHYISSTDSCSLPLHIAKPEQSIFNIQTHTAFKKMSTLRKQDLIRRRKVIVITDMPVDECDFDEDGLSILAGIDVSVDIQGTSHSLHLTHSHCNPFEDQSIDVKDGDYSRRLKYGTLRQMLDSSRSANGRILNALNFPLAACDRTPDGGIASDLAAWTLTENTAWCNGFCSLFPTRDVRWGLAANAGAIHWFHIDSDGFGTYVDVVSKNGKKLWLVARPVDNPAAFFRTNLFSLEDYTMEGPNEHKFIIEAILLAPGMRL